MTFRMSELGFFIVNMLKEKTEEEKDKNLDAIAELWVNLVLAQIKDNKRQEEDALANKN